MADSLVTVAQFHGSSDAAVAKHAMDSAGIESEVEDVRLEVHHEDAYRAFGVLDTVCPALPIVEEAYEAPAEVTICTRCESSEVVSSRRRDAFAAVATISLSVGVAVGFTEAAFLAVGAAGLFLLMSDRWRCTACGHTWN